MPVTPVVMAIAAHRAVAVPPLAEACGWVAGTIGVVTGWPQAWRLWAGRRHEGLSLVANVLAVLYATAWLLYGVATHSQVQVVTNILGVAALLVILVGHLWVARPAWHAWLPLLLTGWAVIGAMFAVGARPLGVTASAATIVGVLPQAVVLFRARQGGHADAAGVSRTRWVLSCVCNVLWVAYGLLAADPVIMVNSSIIAVLAISIALLAAPRPLPASLLVEPDYAVAA